MACLRPAVMEVLQSRRSTHPWCSSVQPSGEKVQFHVVVEIIMEKEIGGEREGGVRDRGAR